MTPRPKQPPTTARDRDLAIRLGSLMLCTMSPEGGSLVRAIDETGLTFTQMKALVRLSSPEATEAPTVKDVAEGLGLSLASASRAVDGLVRRGLASRVEDPDDRRVRRVSLTDDGQAIGDELMAARLAGLESFVRSLSSDERRKLDAALEVLLRRDDMAATYRTHRKRVSG